MKNNHEKVGKVTTESVFKFTGKHWDEWLKILGKAGASSWTHQEITAYLKKKHKLGPWWQQGVALGYQIATGKREEGKDAKGNFSVTATKSFKFGVQKLWSLLTSPAGQELWLKPLYPLTVKAGAAFETLDGFFGEIRTLKKNRSIRLTWRDSQDPDEKRKAVIQIILVQRANGTSILCFNHLQIRDLKTQAQARKRWTTAAEALRVSFL